MSSNRRATLSRTESLHGSPAGGESRRPPLPPGWMSRSATPSRSAIAAGIAGPRPASASPHGRGAGARGSSAEPSRRATVRRPSPPPPRKPHVTLRQRHQTRLAHVFEQNHPHMRGVPSRGHNLKRAKNHGPSKLSKTRKASSKERSK
jgi:hypothetical protein